MTDEIREVAPADWTRAVADALTTHGFFDSLHAVDELGRPTGSVEHVRARCRLVRWEGPEPHGLQLHTRVPREEPVLDSLAEVAPGAVWHEREAHDFYGIHFTGGDDRPLLVHPPAVDAADGAEPFHPMRKDAVLAARVTQPWPGGKDPEETGATASRRRMAPAGVPDPEVWGAREPGNPADPVEVAQALQGGRVRRRR